jgi:hypothetical protein
VSLTRKTDEIFALSNVPKLYREITLTNPRTASNVDRSGTFSIDLFDGSARVKEQTPCWTFEGRRNLDGRETARA